MRLIELVLIRFTDSQNLSAPVPTHLPCGCRVGGGAVVVVVVGVVVVVVVVIFVVVVLAAGLFGCVDLCVGAFFLWDC